MPRMADTCISDIPLITIYGLGTIYIYILSLIPTATHKCADYHHYHFTDKETGL